MKVVIFAGGSGSAQLQTGIHELFGNGKIDYSIVTNLFDNGLSTGKCRQVLEGKMLGPSDLRKNQLRRIRLEGVDQSMFDMLNFLDERISKTVSDVKIYLTNRIKHICVGYENRDIPIHFLKAIDAFFETPLSRQIDYIDFSVSNIIYTGLSICLNDPSLDKVGELFEDLFHLPKNSVVSSSIESLYLHAKTESGFNILDEADIVSWNNQDDKIISCDFLNNNGQKCLPVLSEKAQTVIEDADVIIISPGTLWSSIIPTLMSTGLREMLKKSTAKKYFIMNVSEDLDVVGRTGNDILEIVSKYIDIQDFKIVCAENSVDTLKVKNKDHLKFEVLNTFAETQNRSLTGKHNPIELVKTIFFDVYSDYLQNDTQFFDFDDTLCARGNAEQQCSQDNIELFNNLVNHTSNGIRFMICTGNSVKALPHKISKRFGILADGGINLYYECASERFVCLDKTFEFTNSEIDEFISIIIKNHHALLSKISLRGKTIISIKPLEWSERESLSILLQEELSSFNLDIRKTGRTTIDICKHGLDKIVGVKAQTNGNCYTYVGDEFNTVGNDYLISLDVNASFLKVSSVKDTYCYLKVLQEKFLKRSATKY